MTITSLLLRCSIGATTESEYCSENPDWQALGRSCVFSSTIDLTGCTTISRSWV